MKKIYLLFFITALTINLFAQTSKELGLNAITKSAIRGQLEFLASDWTEGRATGTKGEYLAGDYIASMFKLYGLEPFGDEEVVRSGRMGRMSFNAAVAAKTYFQNINLMEYKPGQEQKFAVVTSLQGSESAFNFNYKSDFSVSPGSVGFSAKAPVIFAGYGLTDDKNGYDDYKKIDVKGKIVLVLNGFPGHRDRNSETYKKFRPEGFSFPFSRGNSKAERARKLGAVAVIEVRPGEDPTRTWAENNNIYPVKEADLPVRPPYDSRPELDLQEDSVSGRIPVFTVTGRVVNEILNGSGINLAAFEKNVQEKPQPASAVLPGKLVSFATSVDSKIIRARNVLGYIEGERKNEIIVVGGHYDHMGKIDNYIWNGADDNASGTVGVMTIAKAFMASGKKPEKSIVFATWTGEESGLLGSKYFVSKIPPDKRVVLNLNYDMIARNTTADTLGNRATLYYTEDYKGIKEITENTITSYKINLNVSYMASKVPRIGSDQAPFAEAGIPVLYFEAAYPHPDYHQPTDELSKINWDKMTEIIKTGYLDVWEFANGDKYLQPMPAK